MKFKNQAQFFEFMRKAYPMVRKLTPNISSRSGIYVFWRKQIINDVEVCYAYVGKASNLLDRVTSHIINPAQHIDRSLSSRGIAVNMDGEKPILPHIKFDGEWHCKVALLCPKNELNDKEKEIIAKCLTENWQLPYNKNLGGTTGKETISTADRKGYMKGKQEGYDKAFAELREFFVLEALPMAFKKDGTLYKSAQELLRKFEEKSVKK